MPSPAPTSPTTFTFHACLGEGGFGEVYRATAESGGKSQVVAVKVLHVERQRQRAAVDRLRDEAKMLAVLNHSAILRFQKFIRIDGRLALVTEYVEGIDISAFASAESPMPLKAALEVIATVSSALTSALLTPSPETGRPLGLVHRDIKPHNIRISRSGHVKLLDFGIARTTELARDAQTWMGEILCTPGYASPELLCGDSSGHPSDIYALGVTLFGLIAHTPFHTATTIPKQRKVALLRDVYADYLESRMALLPELPPELLGLLRRMLAYDQEERPDGAEVEAGLLRIAAAMDGPGLKFWSRGLPAHQEANGELCGRTLEETPIGVEPTAIPAASVRRPPPAASADLEYTVPGAAPPVAAGKAAGTPAAGKGLPWEWIGAALGLVIAALAWLWMR